MSATSRSTSVGSGRLEPAQELLPFDDFTAFGRMPFSLRGLPDEVLNHFKETVPRLSGKQAADDTPSWSRGFRPMIRENGADFAERLMNQQYGRGAWRSIPDREREYQQIKKWGDRGFQIPRSILDGDVI